VESIAEFRRIGVRCKICTYSAGFAESEQPRWNAIPWWVNRAATGVARTIWTGACRSDGESGSILEKRGDSRC